MNSVRLNRSALPGTITTHQKRTIRVMPGSAIVWMALWALVFPGGCAPKLAGSWEIVDVQPAGASFPFNRVQLDANGKYTASGLYDASGRMCDEVRTTTGDYRQDGSQLRFRPHKGDAQTYRMRRRLDGKIEVSLDVPNAERPIRAVLSPASP